MLLFDEPPSPPHTLPPQSRCYQHHHQLTLTSIGQTTMDNNTISTACARESKLLAGGVKRPTSRIGLSTHSHFRNCATQDGHKQSEMAIRHCRKQAAPIATRPSTKNRHQGTPIAVPTLEFGRAVLILLALAAPFCLSYQAIGSRSIQ